MKYEVKKELFIVPEAPVPWTLSKLGKYEFRYKYDGAWLSIGKGSFFPLVRRKVKPSTALVVRYTDSPLNHPLDRGDRYFSVTPIKKPREVLK